MTLRRSAMLLVVTLLASGCGTFSHEKTPPLTTFTEASQFVERPSVRLSVRVSTKKSGATMPLIDARNTDNLKKIVAMITENSKLFGQYSWGHSETFVPDYIIAMELVHDFNSDSWASLPLAFLQGVSEGTLWIIPFPASIYQTLTTKISDRQGKLLKTYDSIDGVTTWLAIWSYPFTKEQMETVLHENWEKMIGNAYHMMIVDGIFRQNTLSQHK